MATGADRRGLLDGVHGVLDIFLERYKDAAGAVQTPVSFGCRGIARIRALLGKQKGQGDARVHVKHEGQDGYDELRLTVSKT